MKKYIFLLFSFLVFAIAANAQYKMVITLANGEKIEKEVWDIQNVAFEPLGSVATPDVQEAVDLGLSVKWATKNVGASSPSDYGDYFAWGETRPKSSYVDGQTRIATTSGHDTSRENWGGTWRMPTKAEFEELCNGNNCKWTWTSQGGHWGYLVTSKINRNSIFLPAAGCRRGTGRYNVGEYGYYRSSTLSLSNSNFARYLNINDLVYCTDESDFRSNGHSVRPVTE